MKFDDINRIKYSKVDPGGKGINISRMLIKLGEKSIPLTFITSGKNNLYRNLLKKEKIIPVYVEIKGEIRKIYNFISEKGDILRFNEKGPEISKAEKNSLFKKIKKLPLKKQDIFAISGSLPEGLDKKTYKEIIKDVKKNTDLIFVDADGDILKETIKSSPYIIKPNLWELERTTGEKIKNGKKLIKVVRSLLNKKISIILLTLGEKGAILFKKDKIIYGRPPEVKVKSTVGCGDAFVAGFLLKFKKENSMENCLKYAVACGTAKATKEGTEMPSKNLVEKIHRKTEVKIITRKWLFSHQELFSL